MPLNFSTLFRGGSGQVGSAASIVKLPEDPLQDRRPELEDFDALLRVADAFRETVAEATARVQVASAQLLEHVESCLGGVGDHHGGALSSRCVAQIEGCATRLRCGQPHLDAVQQMIQAAREQSEGVHKALAARDAAWAPKVHCDERAEEVRQRFGPTFSLEEKKARLQAKHSADEAFRTASAEASQSFEGLLARKHALSGSILSAFCQAFAAVFGGSHDLAAELQQLASVLSELRASPPAPMPGDEGGPRRPAGTAGGEETGSAEGGAVGEGPGRPAPAAAGAPQAFAKGDNVQVWSSGEQAWLDAVVEEKYHKAGVADGYWVPAGVLKVVHSKGVKYIRPEQIASLIRRPIT